MENETNAEFKKSIPKMLQICVDVHIYTFKITILA